MFEPCMENVINPLVLGSAEVGLLWGAVAPAPPAQKVVVANCSFQQIISNLLCGSCLPRPAFSDNFGAVLCTEHESETTPSDSFT